MSAKAGDRAAKIFVRSRIDLAEDTALMAVVKNDPKFGYNQYDYFLLIKAHDDLLGKSPGFTTAVFSNDRRLSK